MKVEELMVAVSNPPAGGAGRLYASWEVSFARVSLIRQGGSEIEDRLKTRGQVRTTYTVQERLLWLVLRVGPSWAQ
jgi:hypothetical protein